MLGKGLAQFVVGDRGLSIRNDGVFEAIVRIASDRPLDRAARVLRNAVHEPEIFAFDAPRLHRDAQRRQRFGRLGYDQQSRGIAVEPMHESGAQRIAGQRADVREQRVDQRAARRTVRRMRHHPGGLIDHQEIVVLIHDRNVDRFGAGFERLARNDFVDERVAVFERMAALDGTAVHAHRTALDRIGDERARGAG